MKKQNIGKKLPFIILAGSPSTRDEIMDYAHVDYKVLIDIHGKTMLNRILEAVNQSNLASRIFITGIPEDKVELPAGFDSSLVEFFNITGDTVDKITQAANYVIQRGNDDPTIFPAGTTHTCYLNGDIPAITGSAITRFINSCEDRTASFYYSIVPQENMDKRFPDNGRTYTKIDGVYYCGADIVIGELSTVEPSYPILKKILENRKSFIKALFWASPITFFKFILKRVGIKDAERLMTKIFKLKSKLIISKDAEIAFDVDKIFQLDLIQKYFFKQTISDN